MSLMGGSHRIDANHGGGHGDQPHGMTYIRCPSNISV